MARIRILADDLTGALDSAAAFAGDVPVWLDAPVAGDAAGSPVAVVATATRDVPIESLPARLAPSLAWLAGADIAFKKVDSLLRGNTFAEIAFVARAGGYRRIVFAPAFPAQGRVTIGGRQCVIAPGASLRDREPIGAGSPADAFAVFGIPVLAAGETSHRALVASIPDVATEDELVRLAAPSRSSEARHWLWCGSAGLAHAMAAALGLAPEAAATVPTAPRPGPVLLISASHHPVVRRQWDVLKTAERGAVMVTRGQQAALRSAFRAMGGAFDLAMFDLSPDRLMPAADAAALLAKQLDAIVHAAPRPAAVVVVGGDTLRSLCRATATRALMSRATTRAGWGCARLVGGAWDGLTCHTRSGAFGDADDLTNMVRRIVERTATAKEA